ncbi:MAG: 2-hydroxychromene-2-carboxylate isomerase [Vicinamibacteria bacterium]|jgi:2-hydroxychromene-2-carboxylate isomerase
MEKTVDYYFATNSPWSYLGHERFVTLAHEHGATVNLYPIDLGKVFPISGGLPLAKRAPQRQAYRLFELKRWSEHLRVPIHLQPKFAGANPDEAARWVLAALEHGIAAGLSMAGGVLRARWAEERDASDPATLRYVAHHAGLDVDALAARAGAPEIQARYDEATQKAIDAQVFGAPWYVYRGEPFWGQDRLDFLARALAK